MRPRRGARRVALRDVLGALPAERRERDDPRVEPDVADLGDPLDRPRRTPRSGSGSRRPTGRRSSSSSSTGPVARSMQLRLRADHVQLPAGAGVERQRQPVVAAARDVPVAHVPQPVVHALAHVGGRPLDGRVRVEERLAELLDRDEPVVGDAEDERRVAAPAVRVAVLVEAGVDEQPALGQVADDLVGRVARRRAVQPAVVVVEAARLVDRRQHRQVVDAGRARSPRRRSPARCGRSPCPPRARPRPRGSPDARPRAPGGSVSNGPS